MKYLSLALFLAFVFALACSKPSTTGNLSTNTGQSNINSNFSSNLTISNVNLNNNLTPGINSTVDQETLKELEIQQKEEQKLAEDRLKETGKSGSNSNNLPKQTVQKGNNRTF